MPADKDVSKHSFQMVYDGGPVAGHTMDVHDLAPALIAMGDLCVEGNRAINGASAKINVLVKSDFEHKCFLINLEIVQHLLTIGSATQDLLNNPDVKEAKEILEWLGLLGTPPGLGLWGYLKFRGKRQEKSVENLNDGDVAIKFEGDNNTIVIQKTIYKLSRSAKVMGSAAKMLEPISRGAADKLEFRDDGKTRVTTDKHSAEEIIEYYDSIEDDKSEPQTMTVPLRIRSPVFDVHDKMWDFMLFDNKISADISATSIAADAIARGGSAINDLYRVKLQVIERHTPGGQTKFDYKILEVLEFRPGHLEEQQPGFDLSDDIDNT